MGAFGDHMVTDFCEKTRFRESKDTSTQLATDPDNYVYIYLTPFIHLTQLRNFN